MDLDRLEHRLEPDARVGLAVLGLDRVDRRAGQEQDVLGDPLRFQVLQVEDQVALVERAGAGDHRGVDAGDRPREGLFRGVPFRAVGADVRRAGPHRGRLAEIDAVEPGQEVDHLAPDAAGLGADARRYGRRSPADWRRFLVASRTIRTVPPA